MLQTAAGPVEAVTARSPGEHDDAEASALGYGQGAACEEARAVLPGGTTLALWPCG